MTSKSHLHYLIAVLNSWVFDFAFKDRFPELLGGTRELSKVFFELIPIPKISQEKQKPFEVLVEKILEQKNTPIRQLPNHPSTEGNNTENLENQKVLENKEPDI